jgi:hypothetical protein
MRPPARAAADVPRRAPGGVRRPLVAGAGEDLREQDRVDDLAGGVRVRPAPGLGAQGDQ